LVSLGAGFGLLLTSDCKSALEIALRFRRIRRGRLERDFPGDTIDLGVVPSVPSLLDACHRFVNATPSLF
jgi:hypothetical protein